MLLSGLAEVEEVLDLDIQDQLASNSSGDALRLIRMNTVIRHGQV